MDAETRQASRVPLNSNPPHRFGPVRPTDGSERSLDTIERRSHLARLSETDTENLRSDYQEDIEIDGDRDLQSQSSSRAPSPQAGVKKKSCWQTWFQSEHHPGPLIYKKFLEHESMSLHAPFDQQERRNHEGTIQAEERVRHVGAKGRTLRWCIDGIVGVGVGTVASAVHHAVDALETWKAQSVENIIEPNGFCWSALAVSMAFTVVMALLATLLVVWQPAAASSGIPAVIAFLNGIDLRKTFNGRTFIAKVLGVILAVGSGLAVGPEGPMVHMGAIFGMIVVRDLIQPVLRRLGKTRAWACDLELDVKRNPLSYDVRAAAVGAGAGIAAAFHAPIAGTVFVVEEASSYFSKSFFLHAFLTCVYAVGTCGIIEGLINNFDIFDAIRGDALFSVVTHSNCMNKSINYFLILEVAILGAICGTLAKVFNGLIVKLNTWRTRQAFANPKTVWRWRVAEVMFIAVLTATFSVAFPSSMSCQQATLQLIWADSDGCIEDAWHTQVMAGSTSVPESNGSKKKVYAFRPTPGLFGAQYNPDDCPAALAHWKDHATHDCSIHGIMAHLKNVRDPETVATHYCCGFDTLSNMAAGHMYNYTRPAAPLMLESSEWPLFACNPQQDVPNSVEIPSHRPSAALAFVPAPMAVKNLFRRGAPHILPPADILLFLIGYFFLAVMTAGTWVPSGLIVPMMVIGGCVGRLFGLGALQVEKLLATPHAPVHWIPELQPILDVLGIQEYSDLPDPGVLAMVGSAAFLGGSGSIVLFVIVMMIEITADPEFILAITLGVIVARGFTGWLSKHSLGEGLYHSLIDVQSLPFLPEHEYWRHKNCVAIEVLPGGPDQEGALEYLLQVKLGATKADICEILNDSVAGDKPNGFPVVDEQGQLKGLVMRDVLVKASLPAPDGPDDFEVSDFILEWMDASPFAVPATTPLHHVFMLFRQLGLRHVVVVDNFVNVGLRPIGVITRKSLMPWQAPVRETQSTRSGVGQRHHTDTFAFTRTRADPPRSPVIGGSRGDTRTTSIVSENSFDRAC